MRYLYEKRGRERDLSQEARDLLDEVKRTSKLHLQRVADIKAATHLSQLEREHLAKVQEREGIAKAQAAARELWRHFEPAAELVNAAVKRAAAEGPTFDFQRLAFLEKELEVRLAGPYRLGESALDRAEAIRRDALDKGDIHTLRALRTAATTVLDRASYQGADRARLTHLRHSFEADEAAEAGPDVQLLRAERAQLASLEAEAEHTILATEYRLTGQRPTYFSLSPWQQEVLGQTWESRGGGVVWSEEAKAKAEAYFAGREGTTSNEGVAE